MKIEKDPIGRPVFYVQTRMAAAGKDIEDLLCCAFEGGSNSWYSRLDIYAPPVGYNLQDWKLFLEKHDLVFHLSTPVFGGKLELWTKEDNERFVLDCDSLERGLNILARDYPWHWKSFMDDAFDAYTGDAFLQCCLFGSIVYG